MFDASNGNDHCYHDRKRPCVLLQNPGERRRLAVVCLNIKIDFSFFFKNMQMQPLGEAGCAFMFPHLPLKLYSHAEWFDLICQGFELFISNISASFAKEKGVNLNWKKKLFKKT